MSDIQKLEDFAAYLRNAIEDEKALLALHEKNLKDTEATIAAARLQAWYAANPGIELAVGDQLAVTDEFREDRRGNGGHEIFEGAPLSVQSVHWAVDEYLVQIGGTDGMTGWVCSIPIDTARRMREAWLAQEAGT